MGFHVGIPTLKLANKVGGNASRKRTGTLRAVACEALEERWSRDPDIDRTRTQYNEYEGIRSGLALTEAMTREAEAYSQKRREAGGRALRDTASFGFVTIVKPDMDAVNSMTPDERKRFFADSREILDDILGRDNVRSRVIHRDELGEHEHTFRMGYTEDGTLSVDKLVCPKIWRRVNLEYPKKMREKGWDVEDCEMYDAKRAETDPEYREERKAKRKAAGRGSSKYKMDRDKERAAALDTEQAALEAQKTALDAQAAQQAIVTQQQAQTAREQAQKAQEQAQQQDSLQGWAGNLTAWRDGEQRRLGGMAAQIAADVPTSDAAILAELSRRRGPDGRTLRESIEADLKARAEQLRAAGQTVTIKQPPQPDAVAAALAMAQQQRERDQARQRQQGPGFGL